MAQNNYGSAISKTFNEIRADWKEKGRGRMSIKRQTFLPIEDNQEKPHDRYSINGRIETPLGGIPYSFLDLDIFPNNARSSFYATFHGEKEWVEPANSKLEQLASSVKETYYSRRQAISTTTIS
ncbi:MAG: hypothetical protein AABX51_01755 [Nanoarchaeota archaeon]